MPTNPTTVSKLTHFQFLVWWEAFLKFKDLSTSRWFLENQGGSGGGKSESLGAEEVMPSCNNSTLTCNYTPDATDETSIALFISVYVCAHMHTGHINISAEWHTMVGSKLPPPTLQQQFMCSSACQILSFFINEVLICLETLQSSPAVVPVALREPRVGSLPLSQAWRTKQWPLLSLCGGQWKKGRKKRSPTLSQGPDVTQHHVPTWTPLFGPHRTTLQEPALENKRRCQSEWHTTNHVSSGPHQAPALGGRSHWTQDKAPPAIPTPP